jgi:hypothetical protein
LEYSDDFDWFWSFIIPVKEETEKMIKKQTYWTKNSPLD